ncbi:MAG: branched-chain amino acid ABC transporter substrate-binding protein [Ktedonobacteraceae bacterium]
MTKAQDYLAQTEAPVLDKIIRLANTDNTFVGVAGFPFSATAIIARPILAAAHIPIISPSASSTALTNQPYFFRVIPSDAGQGKDAAQFASQTLNARRVAVFSDGANSYSKSLADSFTSSFTALGTGTDHTVIPESFHLSNADSLDAPLNNMLSQNPGVDMIFLAGYADDLDNMKPKLKESAPSLPIMGGDAFYEFGGYSTGDYSNFYFTAFTYPDIWRVLCLNNTNCSSPAPTATDATQYSQIFDPKGIHRSEYGYDRPGPHVWQSYDATSALLQAVESVQASGQSLTLDIVANALSNVSFQGTTGEISFNGSDPVNKTVVMLCIDSHYHTQLIGTYGQFAPGAKNLVLGIGTIRYQRCA